MSKKIYKCRCIWLLAALIWMAVIFCFSNQKAVRSSEVSQTFTYRIAEGINGLFSLGWDERGTAKAAEKLELPVRKGAHMTEFAILAWIFLGNCMQYSGLKKRKYLWAGAGALFYAAADEFHQLFIEGRSGEIKDVAIDGTGALLGLLFAWLAVSIYHRKKRL